MCTGTQGVCHVVDRVPDSANLPDWPRDDPEPRAPRHSPSARACDSGSCGRQSTTVQRVAVDADGDRCAIGRDREHGFRRVCETKARCVFAVGASYNTGVAHRVVALATIAAGNG